MKTNIARALLLGSLTASAALFSANAEAAPTPEEKAIAGQFFDAGAQAFDAGQYLVAAEAFLKAHDVLKSPALLFSAAQAYRRQFVVDSSPDSCRRAIRLYREYLREDPTGKRHEDAAKALEDLVPIEARLGGRRAALAAGSGGEAGKPGLVPISVPGQTDTSNHPPDSTPSESAPGESSAPESEPPRATRLLISVKPREAEVSVDGGPFVHVPAVVEVKTGPHTVRVKAAGYHDEEMTVDAVANELVPRYVVLNPKAGKLLVNGTPGARVSVDGQLRGFLPMEQPIDVEPGAHFVTVGRAGRFSLGKTMTFEPDKQTKLVADLGFTQQRIAAGALLGVGLVGAFTAGAIGLFAWNKEQTVSDLDEVVKNGGTLTVAQRDEYNNAVNARNQLVTPAAITGGAAAVVLLGSLGMFLFDEPEILSAPAKGTDAKAPPARVDLTVGLASMGLRVVF